MRLDTKQMRYLTAEDWKVLAAVEQGTKNHSLVPTPLIHSLSSLRSPSAVSKSISTLAKTNLIARIKNAKYDGYRLTYGGLDYLALHTHTKSSTIYSVGNQIGVGKESDIFVVATPSGTQRVLKIHRLGRISFRTVKSNRDYLARRGKAAREQGGNWMYMSRLAAVKEHAFMRALRDNDFVVPEPIAQSRHTVVMELIDAFPLRQIASVPDPAGLYAELMDMILRLARYGLIHGDFNEFNILVREDLIAEDSADAAGKPQQPKLKLTPILIDFPQMLSMDHVNAEMYFDRDVQCIKTFFRRKFGFTSSEPGPFFSDAKKLIGTEGAKRLDIEVEATGFSKKMAKELESYMAEVGVDGDAGGIPRDDVDGENGEEGVDEDEEDEEEEEEEEEEELEEVEPAEKGLDLDSIDERDAIKDKLGNTIGSLRELKVGEGT